MTVPNLAPPSNIDAENDRLFFDAPEQKGPTFKEVVKNPVSTVRSAMNGASRVKFAETNDNQVIVHEAEVRLVRAYDEVVDAVSEADKIKATDNLEELKETRQDWFVRWTLDRSVLMIPAFIWLRSENIEITALNITQLIEQHGSHGWTDALRQDLGTRLLLQLQGTAHLHRLLPMLTLPQFLRIA
ncbi:MAG: hypothetical protein Q9170_000700 [Blastenia crenularia]